MSLYKWYRLIFFNVYNNIDSKPLRNTWTIWLSIQLLNLTITMNTGVHVVLHSPVIHAVVRVASGASQETQLILMTFGTLTELQLLQLVSKLTLTLGHKILNGLPLLKRDGGSTSWVFRLFSSDELEGSFCRVSLSRQSEEIVMSTSIFYPSIYILDLTSSSIFTLPVFIT